MNISKNLEKYLLDNGATEVAYADLRDYNMTDYDYGVSFFIKLPKEIVLSIESQDNNIFFKNYHETNNKLNKLALKGEAYLKSLGYDAYGLSEDRMEIIGDKETKIPYKTIATKAGLGWIGKSGVFVNKTYGSALRLSTILTDAPLECAKPVTRSRCGKCMNCMENCPGDAVIGNNWDVSKNRCELLDYQKCVKTLFSGGERQVCSWCVLKCPHTQKYLKKVEI